MKYCILWVLILCILCLSGCGKRDKVTSSKTPSGISSTESFASSDIVSGSSSMAPDSTSEPWHIPADTMVHLKNISGEKFVQVYSRPTNTIPWTTFKLNPNPLPSEGEFLLNLTAIQMAIGTHWDVKMVNSDGTEYIWTDIDMTKSAFVDLDVVNGQTSFHYK